jgi:hypothetical protein
MCSKFQTELNKFLEGSKYTIPSEGVTMLHSVSMVCCSAQKVTRTQQKTLQAEVT